MRRVDAAHRDQYADFLHAISDRRAPVVTVADGRVSPQVVLAIYESARTGHPVELSAEE